MRGIVVTTNGNGDLVEYSATAAIRWGKWEGSCSSINIMEICYRTAWCPVQSYCGRHK